MSCICVTLETSQEFKLPLKKASRCNICCMVVALAVSQYIRSTLNTDKYPRAFFMFVTLLVSQEPIAREMATDVR